MSHYIHRNGIVEQVRYMRQQDHAMRSIPWAHETEAEMKKAARRDALVFLAVVVGIIALMVAGNL